MPMISADEDFNAKVLSSVTPVLVCFGTRTCPEKKIMWPQLERIATASQANLTIVDVTMEQHPALSKRYNVEVSPTILIFQNGVVRAHLVGFLTDESLNRVCSQVLQRKLPATLQRLPSEEDFEDFVLIPLLQKWGYSYRRQYICQSTDGFTQKRGRIDLLVYDHPAGQPLTLFENKRQIKGEHDLQKAREQAEQYARMLWLPSFIVAAPHGLWIYHRTGHQSTCVKQMTLLALQQKPDTLHRLLQRLRQ